MDGNGQGPDGPVSLDVPKSAEVSAPESPVGEAPNPVDAARARAGMNPVAAQALDRMPDAKAELEAAAGGDPDKLSVVQHAAGVIEEKLHEGDVEGAQIAGMRGEQDAQHVDQVADAVSAAADDEQPKAA